MTSRFKKNPSAHPPEKPIPEAQAMLDCVLMLRKGERFAIEMAPASKNTTETDVWSVQLDLQNDLKRAYLCQELLLGLAAAFQFLSSRASEKVIPS